MPNTYVKIASATVGSGGAGSIDFTSIPQTYTDLVIKLSTRTAAAVNNSDLFLHFNGNNTSFAWKILQMYNGSTGGASSSSGAGRVGMFNGASTTANTFASTDVYIPNYTSSNFKTTSSDNVFENNATLSGMEMDANLWSNTSAITSLSIVSSNGNFVQYSTATLYGIKNS